MEISKLPKIKKSVNAFLVGEEGKISKDSLVKAGLLLSAYAIGAALASKDIAGHTNHISHGNDLGAKNEVLTGINNLNRVSAAHGHHASHGSHGSHGNNAPCDW